MEYDDLIDYNVSFLKGETQKTSYHNGQVDCETVPFLKLLIELNHLGFLTVCSQPGHLNSKGIRQKPFLEFYMNKNWFPYLNILEEKGYCLYVSDNKYEEIYCSPNLSLPAVVSKDITGEEYTWIPSRSVLSNSFHDHFTDDEDCDYALKDSYLVQLVYPKFYNKNIFKDLLNFGKEHAKYVAISEELKDNCLFIGFGGKMGSGKDFLIDNYLVPKLQNFLTKDSTSKYLKVAFADTIKVQAILKHGADHGKVFGKRDVLTRTLLQKTGTESGRNTNGSNIWLKNFLLQSYLHYKNNGISIFITSDIRFQNERDLIKSLNGTTICIVSPKRTEERHILELSDNMHSSEQSLDNINFDYLIKNDPFDLNISSVNTIFDIILT